MIHIREYKDDGTGKIYPTRKGVSFTKARWAWFIRHMDGMERSVDLLKAGQPVDYYQHIGGRYYVSISKEYRCVNIRRYFMPPNTTKEVPTRSGIALRLIEWDSLLLKIRELQEHLPELKLDKPCYTSADHANQLGYLARIVCNPFGLDRVEQYNG